MVVVIDILATTERYTVPVESDHYWYDTDEKKLIKLRGGKLAFKYDGGKMIVTADPLLCTSYRTSNNKSRILDWIAANTNEYDFEFLDGGLEHIALSFDDSKQQQLEESLYRERFEYNILGRS